MTFSCELEHGLGYSSTEQQSLHVLPNGRDFVYVQGSSAVIRAFDDPHEQVFLRAHAAPLTCAVLSPRGRLLATGDSGTHSDIVVWDVETKRQLWRFGEHDDGVKLLAFSHDERLLLSLGYDDRLAVFDMKTNMLVAQTEIPSSVGNVACAQWGGFVKNLKRRDTSTYQFATVGDTVNLWSLDPYAGALAISPADSKRNVRQCVCACFVRLPDSAGRAGYVDEHLVTGTLSGDFISYLIKPNKTSMEGPPEAHFVHATKACSGGVTSVVPSPVEATTLLVGGGDGAVSVFRYDENAGMWIDTDGTRMDGPTRGLAFSPCGQEVVAGSRTGRLIRGRVGNLARHTTPIASNPCGALTGISFEPDSNTVFATASEDGMIRVWSSEDYSVSMETTVRGAGYPTCLEFSIDAVLSGWTDGRVRSHHATTGELLWEIKDAHTGGVSALRISNNIRYIVTGGEEGDVRVWELRQRQLVSHLKEHSQRVTRIILFDDDTHAISCSKDRSFLCWDLPNDKRISAHTQRMGGINDIALNHDQTMVISMGQERSISFWDLREQDPILSIKSPNQGMHMDEATSIAVSHSGGLFATGGADAAIKLWKIEEDHPVLLETSEGHTSRITGMSFTADDRQLVSVGADGCIFIWNIFPDIAGAESKFGEGKASV